MCAVCLRLLGGNEEAIRRLDSFFHDAQGNWALVNGKLHPGFDNEPCLETPWLYDFAGAPYKTQQTVRAILDTLWHDAPGGIPGNDDLGEMSSWYVWAALGMYPEIPGRAELVLASPLFPEAEIHRPLGAIRIIGALTRMLPLSSLRVCTSTAAHGRVHGCPPPSYAGVAHLCLRGPAVPGVPAQADAPPSLTI